MAPFGSVGASMRSSEEDYAVSCDEDGALFIGSCEAVGEVKSLVVVSSKS